MLLLQNTISARNRHRYHHRHHHQMQYHYHHHHFSIITISSFPCRSVVSLWSSPSTSSVPNNLLGMCKDCLVQSFPFQLATPKNIQFSRSVDWVIHQKPLLHPLFGWEWLLLYHGFGGFALVMRGTPRRMLGHCCEGDITASLCWCFCGSHMNHVLRGASLCLPKLVWSCRNTWKHHLHGVQ